MLDVDQNLSIARKFADAMFGYTHAAINAAFEANARALAVCLEVGHVLDPAARAKDDSYEWSGAPRRPRTALKVEDVPAPGWPHNPFAAFATLFEAEAARERMARLSPFEAPNPLAWWTWTPQSAAPATWPWAYSMMSSGIPGSVAWPMAEANVALMDAATTAAQATAASFPAYRSDAGFASAQVWPWVDRAA